MRIFTSILCTLLCFSTSLAMEFLNEEASCNTKGDKYVLTAFKNHTDPNIITTMIRNESTNEVLDSVNLNLETLSSDFRKLTDDGRLRWIEIQKKEDGEIVFRIKDKFAEGIQADSWSLIFDGYSIIHSNNFPFIDSID